MKTKSKKYFVMFEMHHCVSFSSASFDSLEAAKFKLEELRKDHNPFISRLAVGFWEEYPDAAGNLKIFHICCECFRVSCKVSK